MLANLVLNTLLSYICDMTCSIMIPYHLAVLVLVVVATLFKNKPKAPSFK